LSNPSYQIDDLPPPTRFKRSSTLIKNDTSVLTNFFQFAFEDPDRLSSSLESEFSKLRNESVSVLQGRNSIPAITKPAMDHAETSSSSTGLSCYCDNQYADNIDGVPCPGLPIFMDGESTTPELKLQIGNDVPSTNCSDQFYRKVINDQQRKFRARYNFLTGLAIVKAAVRRGVKPK
jgi:hypothetical protein